MDGLSGVCRERNQIDTTAVEDTYWDPINPRTRAHPNGLAQRCATVLTCANQVDSNDKVSAAPVDVVLADAAYLISRKNRAVRDERLEIGVLQAAACKRYVFAEFDEIWRKLVRARARPQLIDSLFVLCLTHMKRTDVTMKPIRSRARSRNFTMSPPHLSASRGRSFKRVALRLPSTSWMMTWRNLTSRIVSDTVSGYS